MSTWFGENAWATLGAIARRRIQKIGSSDLAALIGLGRLAGAVAVLCAALLVSSQPALAGFFQQGPKLIGTGAVGPSPPYQGTAVALSADGTTAIVGGYDDNGAAGAVWIFTRKAGGEWPQQGSKLVGSGAIGVAFQGSSVALSADGTTAIVGGPMDHAGVGAVWIFAQNIAGKWTQQAKMVGSGPAGASRQGNSVALSADGNMAIVGGPGDNGGAGAVWFFVRNFKYATWTQFGPKKVGTGAVGTAQQGSSVALSGDGKTAFVGGPYDDSANGAAWVFTRGAAWAQLGDKLVGNDAVGAAFLGQSVALSSDGNTAIVGGNNDHGSTGAAWVFTSSGGVWTQQGSKLVGTGAVGFAAQGSSVSASGDGNMAIVGGSSDDTLQGAAWIFTRSAGAWSQLGNKLVGTDAVGQAHQGASVAISDDGNTALMSGFGDNASQGAAWIFVQPPASLLTATHDFTGDGKSDFITRDSSGNVFGYFINKFSSITSAGKIGSVPSNWQMVAQHDFVGDGNTDILWRDPGNGTVTLWLMDGFQLLGATTLGYVPTRWVLAGAGDFNHDGVTDILWRDKITGTVAIWFMGGTRIKSQTVGTVPTAWSIIGASADGDIFWQHTSGNVAVWVMNETDVADSYSLDMAPANSSLAGIGDFDGNGFTDLLWQDNSTPNHLTLWPLKDGGFLFPNGATGVTVGGPGGTTVALTGDFNGDGYSDIVWTTPGNIEKSVVDLMRGSSHIGSISALGAFLNGQTFQSTNAE